MSIRHRLMYQNSDVITVAAISVPRRSTHGPGLNSGNAIKIILFRTATIPQTAVSPMSMVAVYPGSDRL